MEKIILLALGGALGTICRYGVNLNNLWADRVVGRDI